MQHTNHNRSLYRARGRNWDRTISLLPSLWRPASRRRLDSTSPDGRQRSFVSHLTLYNNNKSHTKKRQKFLQQLFLHQPHYLQQKEQQHTLYIVLPGSGAEMLEIACQIVQHSRQPRPPQPRQRLLLCVIMKMVMLVRTLTLKKTIMIS